MKGPPKATLGGNMTQKTAKAWVSGRVQGVGFRYFTAHQAQKWGLTGYAKNLNDGRVEVLASGDEHSVELLLDWLKTGPPTSTVAEIAVEYVDHEPMTRFSMY
jgi:acylphosphatase